ncbi:hypothetical protein MMYC01_202987 [Madurella mycetomatis]|uniref:Uncharacterized protein n=1 Tax=Madurella mycetomatis TaxID=100816 RepID=A0A175WDS4_9PEZI|nr:hypothetical protein MMYC01_202987 [Madurella mycetomatis]
MASLRSLATQCFTPANSRALFVKVTPAPGNLTERRAVLRALRQYADIEVFKKLHDPSSFVSVAASHSSAVGIIARSPLQFDYRPEHDHAPASSVKKPSANKTFTVTIFREPDYKHKTHIKESPVYGRWPQEESLFHETSFARGALRLAVPRDMAWEGLSDWETGGQLEGPETHASLLSGKKDFAEARLLRKMNRSTFRSLTELYTARHGTNKAQ